MAHIFAPVSAHAKRMRLLAWVLLPLLAVTIVTFLTVGARGDWGFVLELRGRRLAALAMVGFAIAVSTVVFHTITENRILTPSILGFDALFVLIQTVLVFVVGSAALATIPPVAQFVGEVVLMVALSTLLFRWLFGGKRRSLHILVLVGIVCGVLFRSVASFFQRIIDPNEFVVLQDRLFASFNAVDSDLLLIAAVLLAGASYCLWRLRRDLDVLALGRDLATVLGADHRGLVLRLLMIVSVLVSVSTALVGPITFFGLLVASLAYQLTGSHRHAANLPVAVVLAVIALVGGQTILEHVFGLATVLSVIIEFIGGIVFIFLVTRAARP
ncbi:iron chelate uptake ABC transporter family permease subunit [Cryobacterium sp. PH29-G1]|uniref:iron chelate uptake ABC transporter family permease subunit n=1 Tax=Cryobacterium sp. PH29-G1 TaxID=3046211 RepID=UPI0024BAC87F|nr:iron chelate uptake ABC transporter family permease subunit [Cryobacterium sp. PH29-G1]MDJ0350785.1 iron chelate uptake ABC transporter family permease subunit [Cryobacterium sp. PH29-G1]